VRQPLGRAALPRDGWPYTAQFMGCALRERRTFDYLLGRSYRGAQLVGPLAKHDDIPLGVLELDLDGLVARVQDAVLVLTVGHDLPLVPVWRLTSPGSRFVTERAEQGRTDGKAQGLSGLHGLSSRVV
jgi:hypothetical protein